MESKVQNLNSESLFTLTEEAIKVEKMASNEIREFRSTQISKVTNEESGQNQQNYQRN